MVADLLFFAESLGRNRDEGERWMWPDVPHRATPLARGIKLTIRPVRHEAQIHVALRPGLAARVGAEEQHAAQWQRAVHRFEALAQSFAVWFERGRQVFKQQLHDRGA